MEGSYLYGIIGAEAEMGFGPIGLGGAPVYTVTDQGLGAVVSPYDGKGFEALGKEELLRCLLAQQRVVERVMERQAVLPVKFGTFLSGATELRAALSQGHCPLVSALASIQNKVEMEVAATWDTQHVLQEIGREEAVVRAREAILSQGPPNLEERARLGRLVKISLDQRRDRYQKQMVDFLKPLALDAVANALLSDELVMNVAFLIERAREGEFGERLEQLDQLFHNEIAFRVIGPLPPYSFSTVEITRLASPQVEEAQQTLGLGETFTEAEVRQAYRRRAAQAQGPSTRGNEPAQLAQLKQASELLLRYCRSGPPQSGGEDRWAIVIRRAQEDEVEAIRFGGGT